MIRNLMRSRKQADTQNDRYHYNAGHSATKKLIDTFGCK
nr:MAG TPA: hypothetical protein [Caudoviricetes sp.]